MPSDWEAWAQAQQMKRCSTSCWVRHLALSDALSNPESASQTNLQSVNEQIRKAAATKLYQRIKSWQTRVIRIEPASGLHEPVICTLLVADVIVHEGLGIVEEDGPREVPYEALSYTWGAPVFSHPIHINDILFYITENLDSALRYLRLINAKRYLWIDALCINQFDVKDKSIQVGRMFPIYKKACRVVAWNSGWTRQKSAVLSAVLENMSETQKHSPECITKLKELREFLACACEPPLFKRTWVRQEVFAARDLVMQFGKLQISWECYEKIKGFIAMIGDRVGANPQLPLPDITDAVYLKSPYYAIRTLVQPDYAFDKKARNERTEAPKSAPVSLLDALVFSSSFGVTDPRDFVYGILGFTTVPTSQVNVETGPPILNVDYSRSISEVYQSVVLYEIKRSGSLGILDFAGSQLGPSDLPSWTPDWRCYDPAVAQHRILSKTNSWRYGFIDIMRVGVSWKPCRQQLNTEGLLHTQGIVLGVLQNDVDEDTCWRPFISQSFESGFRERFGGRNFDDTGLFPGVKRDYKSTFHDLYDDNGPPLLGGKLSGLNASKAGERLMTLLQNEMLQKIRHAVRDRIIAPPEPIRGNHILGFASQHTSVVPQQSISDDVVVLLRGSPFPFVLRRSGQEHYTFIGRAIFPLWFEHKSASFDDFRMSELAWSSSADVYTETSNILESRLVWPEKMASIWKPALQDAELLGALGDFMLA
ncbi:heterokaryon incompatibility protein-domain-containing protein [Whalleya microplaca]|nr:heterokaryon incompatibility protein-domain-containing protein [Whalleya microplaca]